MKPDRTRSLSPAIALLATVAALPAQLPAGRPMSAEARQAVMAIPDLWRIPIHTQPATADASGGHPAGVHGWWASGETFKASFHDGFTFHPVLGPAWPEDLPWRWTTESVTVDGAAIVELTAAPVHTHTDWRYEYHRPGMTEAYDVRADGVEQAFVLTRPVHVHGDLVVTGRIDTRLRLTSGVPATGAHIPLSFGDAQGRPIVQYGAAFAVDAAGRRTAVATTWDGAGEHSGAADGGRISLTVPGAWLAEATWPVTIDPLTSGVAINAGGTLIDAVVSHEDESARLNTMVFYTRSGSGGTDAAARLCDDDFVNSIVVFSRQMNINLGVGNIAVAFVGGADRWVLAYPTIDPVLDRPVTELYFHTKGNLALNSGPRTESYAPFLDGSPWFPALGGTASSSTGADGLLVYMVDRSISSYIPTPTTEIWGVRVNAAAGAAGNPFQISRPGNVDAEYPDVTNASDGAGSSWIVAWQQLANTVPGDDTKAFAARVGSDFRVAGVSVVGPFGGAPTRHKVRPRVEGRGGRYLVAMLSSSTAHGSTGTEIPIERFDWPENAAQPTRLGAWTLATAFPQETFSQLQLEFDGTTRSHWCAAWRSVDILSRIRVRRLGQSGGTVESTSISGSGPLGSVFGPAIAFNGVRNEFQFVYGAAETGNPIYGVRLQHPADAVNVEYGTGCGAGVIAADPPYAGSGDFGVRLAGLSAGTPCVLFLGFGPGAIPLGAAGMPGCVFNLDLAGPLLAFPTAVAGAVARVGTTLPDNPVFAGDLYFQWLSVQPGLNPVGLGATRGLRAQVR